MTDQSSGRIKEQDRQTLTSAALLWLVKLPRLLPLWQLRVPRENARLEALLLRVLRRKVGRGDSGRLVLGNDLREFATSAKLVDRALSLDLAVDHSDERVRRRKEELDMVRDENLGGRPESAKRRTLRPVRERTDDGATGQQRSKKAVLKQVLSCRDVNGSQGIVEQQDLGSRVDGSSKSNWRRSSIESARTLSQY